MTVTACICAKRASGSDVRGLPGVLLVDPVPAVLTAVAGHLGSKFDVRVASDPLDAAALACDTASDRFRLVVTELDFPGQPGAGIRLLLTLRNHRPELPVVLFTQAHREGIDVLRVAWEAVRPASVVSKSSSLAKLGATVDEVLVKGRSVVDAELGTELSERRSPWMTVEGYGRLVRHAGHAKMWQALLDYSSVPSYKELAVRTGLSANTIRNYRSDLIDELRLHGLPSASMREMHQFARALGPLLEPILAERLNGERSE